MSVELIGRVQSSVPVTVVKNVFERIGLDPKYKILSDDGGALRGQFRSFVHAAPEREDFELAVSGTRVVLSCYSGTLREMEAAQRDVERFFADEGLIVSLEEE